EEVRRAGRDNRRRHRGDSRRRSARGPRPADHRRGRAWLGRPAPRLVTGNPGEDRRSARGVQAMSGWTTRRTEQENQVLKESMTYVALVGKGVGEGCQEARRLLYMLGTRRFGQPGADTVTAVAAIRETDELEAVCLRIVDPDVRTWED